LLLSRAAFASFLEDEGTKRLLVYSDGKDLGAVSALWLCVAWQALLKVWQRHGGLILKLLQPQHTVRDMLFPLQPAAERQAAAEAEAQDGVLCEDVPSKAG
jgi:hypothetical protein